MMLPIGMTFGFLVIFISIFLLDIKKQPIATIVTFAFGLYLAIKSI